MAIRQMGVAACARLFMSLAVLGGLSVATPAAAELTAPQQVEASALFTKLNAAVRAAISGSTDATREAAVRKALEDTITESGAVPAVAQEAVRQVELSLIADGLMIGPTRLAFIRVKETIELALSTGGTGSTGAGGRGGGQAGGGRAGGLSGPAAGPNLTAGGGGGGTTHTPVI